MHSYNPIDPRETSLPVNSQEPLNLPRRPYKMVPQDNCKNEWRSLVQHYEEVDQKSRMMEQYAKKAFQKKMKEDLDRQLNERKKIAEEESLKASQIDGMLLLKDKQEAQ